MNPSLNPINLLAVGGGAALGACLRWWLSARFNTALPNLPFGTLLANLLGAYVIGVALAAVTDNAAISLQTRLFLMTGFCGGLTTFSTFSAETVSLLLAGKWGPGALLVAVHLFGSLFATIAGMSSLRMLRALWSTTI